MTMKGQSLNWTVTCKCCEAVITVSFDQVKRHDKWVLISARMNVVIKACNETHIIGCSINTVVVQTIFCDLELLKELLLTHFHDKVMESTVESGIQ